MIQRVCSIAVGISILTILTASSLLAHEGPHTTVQVGETLSEIAERNNTDVETLYYLNNLTDADIIRHGNLLALPNPDDENAPSLSAAEDLSPQENEGLQEVDEQEEVGVQEQGEQELEEDVSTPLQNHIYRVYVVQPGDTIDAIARQHELSLENLLAINEMSATEALYEGQELLLPEQSPSLDEERPRQHVVQPGETLANIALLYGLSLGDVVQANQLLDPSLIVAGQILEIGEATATLLTVADGDPSRLNEPLATEPITEPPTEERWIDVDLSEQIVVAYEGATEVNRFIMSSGLPATPTVTGEFRIWAKTTIQDMYGGNRAAGSDYYLEDVEWVQYFHKDYGFHGTYWHNNFGQPMSRGCINMRNEDAKWLFEWASPHDVKPGWIISDAATPGTLVIVHE